MDNNDFRLGVRVLYATLCMVILGVAIWFGMVIFGRETADFRGSADATERVRADGSYRIAAYDSFFNQCAAIQGKEATLAALRAELATNPPAGRAAQINATVTAVTASRASAIAQYNADASKTGTAAQFLASTLPYQLDMSQENTTCAVR